MDDQILARAAALLHHRKPDLHAGEALAPPIAQAATFHLPADGKAPFVYGRNGQPGWQALEAQLALIEDADCVIFPSGMAAISAALFATLKAGDRLVLPSDGYYVTRLLASGFLAPLGVEVVELPVRAFETADFTGAAVVYLETPSNPGLDVIDLAATAARARAAGALTIADNTTMTALLQRPLDLGCDLVVAADTKAPAGHSDLLMGHVASRDPALLARVRDWRRISGAIPGGLDVFLAHRGLETLELRLSRMCESAAMIAQNLGDYSIVTGLRYPGLPGDQAYATARRQMALPGFLIGFCLPDAAVAEAFLSACPLIEQTTSFGGTHSSAERRARWGDAVAPGFIRLSVGIEPPGPLWQAIRSALDGVR